MTTEPYILYIEDERSIFELVRHSLNLAGYNVVRASHGQEGLDLMRERKPDVLLLDLMLPAVSGRDVYREMHSDQALADIPVIVVTATAPMGGRTIVKGFPPVHEYITKPFDIEQLIRSVQSLL